MGNTAAIPVSDRPSQRLDVTTVAVRLPTSDARIGRSQHVLRPDFLVVPDGRMRLATGKATANIAMFNRQTLPRGQLVCRINHATANQSASALTAVNGQRMRGARTMIASMYISALAARLPSAPAAMKAASCYRPSMT